MKDVDISYVLETKNPVKLDKADDPVKLDEAEYPVNLDSAEYPVKLDELWFPGRVDVVNLTGLLSGRRLSFWWEGGCWSVILCW